MNSKSGERTEDNSGNKLVWNPRDAWLCILALIALEIGIRFGLGAAVQTSESFANWLESHRYPVQNALGIFRAGMWLLIVCRLSRIHVTSQSVVLFKI